MSHKIARVIVGVLAAEDFAVALAYLIARDYRHAAYWFFAGCICWTTLYL
jgi:hypothetical protein